MREGRGRTLVFARDVAAANAAHRALYAAGLDVLLYHRDVPAAQRANSLEVLSRCFFVDGCRKRLCFPGRCQTR